MKDLTEPITIHSARKLLGKEYAGFSDAQIMELVNQAQVMVDIAFEHVHASLVPNSSLHG